MHGLPAIGTTGFGIEYVIGENSEIVDSIIAPDMDLRGKSRIYNVSLASKVIEDEM